MKFDPTAESLRTHQVPDWYEDAKLGIFIHWGMWTIPAFAPKSGHLPDLMLRHYDELNKLTPYTEWYWNAIRLKGSPAAEHHAKVFGDAPYEAFRDPFEAGATAFNAEEWADLFAAAGARYVVLVTKHHDGYCLWPTAVKNPHREHWASERDYVGELAAAVRARGMRFGIYYSGGLDWTFNERPIANLGDMLASMVMGEDYAAYADAQFRELIARYQPDVLWNDIGFPSRERLYPLLADYLNAVPEGVVNDRWHPAGKTHRRLKNPLLRYLFNQGAKRAIAKGGGTIIPPLPPFCDFRTPEFSAFETIEEKKWEATRGLGAGFGYNRAEGEADMMGEAELVHSFAAMVAKNGNFLLNVGPDETGRIPPMQAERLLWLGRWLKANGEGIYGTRPWQRWQGASEEGLQVVFTRKEARLYAHVLGRPAGALTLTDPPPGEPRFLLTGEILRIERKDGAVRVEPIGGWPDAIAHAIVFEGAVT